MNATKEPRAASAPADPTRGPFRRYLAVCAAIVVVFTAARTAIPGSLTGDGHTVYARFGLGLLGGITAVLISSFLLTTFLPVRARRWGLPAITTADEREAHIAGHAYQIAYIVGLLGTCAYGSITNDFGVTCLGLAMLAAFYTTVVWMNRKV